MGMGKGRGKGAFAGYPEIFSLRSFLALEIHGACLRDPARRVGPSGPRGSSKEIRNQKLDGTFPSQPASSAVHGTFARMKSLIPSGEFDMSPRFRRAALSFLVSCLLLGQGPETTPSNDNRALRPQQESPALPLAGERCVALVIGNGAYRNAPLKNPVNDAQAVAAILRECGFQVDLVLDARRQGFGAQEPSRPDYRETTGWPAGAKIHRWSIKFYMIWT